MLTAAQQDAKQWGEATPLDVLAGHKAFLLPAVAAGYFVTARLGLLLAFQHTNATPVWPPSGIAFAAVLILGYRIWPSIFLGAFSANLVVYLSNHTPLSPTIVAAAACIAVGNSLEAVCAVALLRRLVGRQYPFARVSGALGFVLVTLAACLLSSTIGPVSQAALGLLPWQLIPTTWLTWWLGDVSGILIVAPFLLTWLHRAHIAWTPGRIGESALVLVLIVIAGQILFGGWLASEVITSLPYMIAPLLLWAAFRLSQEEASTAVLVVCGLAIVGTIHGVGSFHRETLNESLLLLQAFVCVIAVTNCALSAAVAERQASAAALLATNASLREHAAAIEQQRVELSTLNAGLRRANRDLDEFAYIVSHDLKAPLRGVSSLATWLEQDYADILDDEGKENLRLMTGRVKRMDNLINGVLAYTRIGRKEIAPTVTLCDSERIVREVIDSLGGAPGIEITIDEPLPAVPYAEAHLVQVFQNLIGNAVKHLGRPCGAVTICCREHGDRWEYGVRDNGIGIAPEHHERIFKAFQTLVPRDQVESTGIGLAVVKKIVEWHGGSIRVESAPGQGSAFFFTIVKH